MADKILVQYKVKIASHKHKGLIWCNPLDIDILSSVVLKWLVDTYYTKQRMGTLSSYQLKHQCKVDAWIVPTM